MRLFSCVIVFFVLTIGSQAQNQKGNIYFSDSISQEGVSFQLISPYQLLIIGEGGVNSKSFKPLEVDSLIAADNRYYSLPVKSYKGTEMIFVQKIVDAPLSLFYKQGKSHRFDQYFFKKEGDSIAFLINQDQYFYPFLRNYFADCKAISGYSEKGLKARYVYHLEDFYDIAIQYNEIVYDLPTVKPLARPKFIQTYIGAEVGVHYFYIAPKDLKGSGVGQMGVHYGMFLEIQPKKTFSYKMKVIYGQYGSDFQNQAVDTTALSQDAYSDLSYKFDLVNVPFIFQYNIHSNLSKLQFGIGPQMSLIIKDESSAVVGNTGRTISNTLDQFLLGGAVVEASFKRQAIGIHLEYQYMMTTNNSFSSLQNLGLGISLDF